VQDRFFQVCPFSLSKRVPFFYNIAQKIFWQSFIILMALKVLFLTGFDEALMIWRSLMKSVTANGTCCRFELSCERALRIVLCGSNVWSVPEDGIGLGWWNDGDRDGLLVGLLLFEIGVEPEVLMLFIGKMIFLFLDKRGKTCDWRGSDGRCVLLWGVLRRRIVLEVVYFDAGMVVVGFLLWSDIHLS
jgi:hypothetical protein